MKCQCQGIEKFFNDKHANKDLKTYRKNGASKETKILIEGIKNLNQKNFSLLEVGGGIGIIQIELLKHGAIKTTDIDASKDFLTVAENEIKKNNFNAETNFINKDFIEAANETAQHDIVTLDKVICCYDDFKTLITLSAEKAKKFYCLVYPKENNLNKIAFKLLNLFFLVLRNPMRTFIHSASEVNKILAENNFINIFHKTTFIWQICIFEKRD